MVNLTGDRLLDKAYKKAEETLDRCDTKHGLYASGGKNGYKGVWSRDSMITLIGASTDKDSIYQEQFKKSIITLGNAQSEKGQIPNAVHGFEDKKKKPLIDFLSIDSTLWWIIGNHIYKKRYNDKSLCRKYKRQLKKAFVWLTYQDMGEDGMLEQLPTTDWQDAFPHKYGRTLNTQALYYYTLKLTWHRRLLNMLTRNVNWNKDAGLWNGNYYWAYRWKNHNKYLEIGKWFDSLGNLMAIVFGLANKSQAKKILRHIEVKRIDKPYPVKAIFPPIKKGDKDWKDYYQDCEAGQPFHYLNGGIWTYIGGFYVLALIKLKMFKKARQALESLAYSNIKGNCYPEWIDPKTKKTHGIFQAWSAGTYMWAYNSLKKKKVLL